MSDDDGRLDWNPADALEVTEVLVAGDRIAFITVGHDDSVGFEELTDGLAGRFYSFNRNHRNFVEPAEGDRLVAEERGRYLSWYGHGGETWFPRDDAPPAGVEFNWDGVRTAGVWVPKAETLERAAKAADPEPALAADCSLDCRCYTDWVNGNVFEAELLVYRSRTDGEGRLFDLPSDYRFETIESQGTYTGVVGEPEDLRAAVEEELLRVAKRLGIGKWARPR